MIMSTPTSTLASVRRISTARVPLASRDIVDKHEAGLDGAAGAQEIIRNISTRRSVTKLILGHNSLGEAGCKELFQFLSSEAGRRYKISEISLNANGIGDEGLKTIAEYLTDNAHLKALFLQNNNITGDVEIASKLSLAINTSSLETLSLNTNHLGDAFFNVFIRHLNSSTLRELQISTIGITYESAPALVTFLTSPRSYPLEILKCNGNNVGLGTLRVLSTSLRKLNFTLRKLEVHAATWSEDEVTRPIAEESVKLYIMAMEELKKVTLRNELLQRRVHEQALSLLRYSRTLLLPSPPCDPSIDSSSKAPPKSLFLALPVELRQQILSFLAPALSVAQCGRILAFACDPSTLQPLLPRLRSGSEGCVPDPANLPFGMGMGIPKMTPWLTSPPSSAPQPPRLCDSGKCMGAGGSVFCHRNEARIQWLARVGCERFEANGRTEDDVLRLLA